MSSENILFVLNQNPYVLEAVKSSKFGKLFKLIVSIDKEIYNNSDLNIPQPIELGAQIINTVNIKSFLTNIEKHEVLKEVEKENIFILSIQNFLKNNTDVSNNQEIVDMVNVHFVHNNICSYAVGSPAKFPPIYFEELKSVSKIFVEKNENNENVILGYDKTIGAIFEEVKGLNPENWCKEFNSFDRVEQVREVLNLINFTPFVINKMQYETTLDLSRVLSDITHKLLLKDIIENIFKSFENKTNINIDYILGREGNGFLLGMFISDVLNIPFVPIRKDSESFGETFEYDSYKVQQNLIKMNKIVLIVDDLIEDGLIQKNMYSLLNFFRPHITLFFALGLNKNNIDKIKENMDDLANNIITL